ncbi:PP2C family protein-serine/threonine phosphatase [Nocardioides sp. Arc9.136]|uniref:PP2C family protein-serine/threonine phosphatase n=1 Tax=Nocardioides sp. Arc9.136 TaxID=2996826 RepID=UPI00266556F2|nr:SpoIIE family protein phosphatase [Nocardioides sp. Arc9.136]WKN50267.1 SpoIIE family protein phosphatase [Nocardioides sp. Arc9.136]
MGTSTEERRQRAVESLALDETGSHDRLDRITRLARTALGVPISTVTVIDGDRAWFPSVAGIELTELPRDQTFCDRTHSDGDTLVVPDARADERFRHLPVVVDGGIRFYAGHPLRDHTGNVIGTFCVYDTEARTFDADEQTTFEDLAAWAELELVASTEMTQAGRVQASLLPSRPIRVEGWTVDGLCVPALAVGGDFYDYGVAQEVLHLGLGDVMGKGTGAALVGAGVRAAIRGTHAAVTAGVDLGITATQVARSLLPDLERSETFVTLLEAAVDLDDGFLRYVDAGAGLALLVRADGTPVALGSDDRPFGVLADDHWTEHTERLQPGDRLVFFSDGLLDLLDDPVDWVPPVADLVSAAPDGVALLRSIRRLALHRTAIDDVTVVAVFREPA